jgi:hypothetical protein
MASGAFQVLYLYRIDGQLHDTPEERKCAEIIARVIAEDFMRISAVIEAECVGVPPDQMAIRYDGILQHGIDRTITTVKELIEGKEVANG